MSVPVPNKNIAELFPGRPLNKISLAPKKGGIERCRLHFTSPQFSTDGPLTFICHNLNPHSPNLLSRNELHRQKFTNHFHIRPRMPV
jgi:hypothetical protein